MKQELNESRLARLLSGRDQPSVIEKEALFERIRRRTAPRRRLRFVKWTAFVLASSSAAIAAIGIGLIDRSGSEFTARGGRIPSSSFTLACVDQKGPSPCRQNSKLSFRLEPADDSEYFAAFARRSDQTIIWYYPDRDSRSPSIATQTERRFLKEGIRLGPEHPPGRYSIYGVFSKKPLTRREIRAALGDALVGDGAVQVVRRDLIIENSR